MKMNKMNLVNSIYKEIKNPIKNETKKFTNNKSSKYSNHFYIQYVKDDSDYIYSILLNKRKLEISLFNEDAQMLMCVRCVFKTESFCLNSLHIADKPYIHNSMLSETSKNKYILAEFIDNINLKMLTHFIFNLFAI
jgi:chlorite dismutase